ncbi:MAG: branched-chain amino acid ABC transporter permease [Rhizobiales bacterium]|nr:branched-chain amino acid ABC transporter permease [Hyphomicrobiales bacterium]
MARLDVSDILDARQRHEAEIATAESTDRPYWLPVTLVLILAALPALQFVGGYNYVLHMVLYTCMYIAMASSWNILGGFTGYISLGHPVFYCVGGYFGGMLLAYFNISTLITAIPAGLLAAALGFVTGLITLKMRGPTFIISSIALLMVARILFDNWDFVGGANGVTLPKLDLTVQWIKLPFYYAFLVIAAVTVYTAYRIKHSKFGLHLRAISQDEVKAESAGIDTRLYKASAFAISAFFVGVCGAVWGEYLTYIRPNLFLILLIGVNMVLMCILGGKGTVAGPIVGAILIVIFNEASVAFFGASEINIMGTGLIMVLTLMFFPNGVVGTLARRKKLPRFLNWG